MSIIKNNNILFKRIISTLIGVSLFISGIHLFTNNSGFKEVKATNPSSPIQIDWTNGTSQPSVNAIAFTTSGGTTVGTFDTSYFTFQKDGAYTQNTSIFDDGTEFINITITVYGGENRTTESPDTLTVSIVDGTGEVVGDHTLTKAVKYASMSNGTELNANTINGDCHEQYVFSGTAFEAKGIKIQFNIRDSKYILRRVVIDYTMVNAADKSEVQSFVNTCMHLGDYTDSKGWCKDDVHHYYETAKDGYKALTTNQKNLFKNDSEFSTARSRYETWAYYYGDTTPYSDAITNSNIVITNKIETNNIVPIIIVISAISLISLSALLVFNKIKK